MTIDQEKEQLQKRLDDFAVRLDAKIQELKARRHRLGQHHGHIEQLQSKHKELVERIDSANMSNWEQTRESLRKDWDGLTQSFDRWVKYVDEEFKQTN